MTNQQSTLMSIAAYEICKRGEEYNPVVVFDTVNALYQKFSSHDLKLMITAEHPEFVDIHIAVQNILDDTYSDAAMGRVNGHLTPGQRVTLLMHISVHLAAYEGLQGGSRFSEANARVVLADIEANCHDLAYLFEDQVYMDECIAFNILDAELQPIN